GLPWEGNYSSWLEQKQARLANEEKADSARRRTLERELEWVRLSPRARQAKGKARLSAYEALLAEAAAAPTRDERLELAIPPGPRLGDLVVEAHELRKGYGDRLLIDGLDFSLPRGGIVGVIGANGAGKTTLLRMITGQDKPDDGSLVVGPTVSLAYVDQSRETLDPSRTVYEEITHDRWFLARVATHVLAFEGESVVHWFEGNFSDYEAERRRRLGAAADQPHRIRYKPLVRGR